jgi:hypothetical protein
MPLQPSAVSQVNARLPIETAQAMWAAAKRYISGVLPVHPINLPVPAENRSGIWPSTKCIPVTEPLANLEEIES